jgi:uncharacterized membrane protein/uncharacterized Zn finger protein (UPF0148 family)
MSFCSKCGVYIAEGSNVCPACGKRVGESAEQHNDYSSGSAYQQEQDRKPARDSGEYSYRYSTTRAKSNERSWERDERYYRRGESRSEDDFHRDTQRYEYRREEKRQYDETAYTGDCPKGTVLSYFGILFVVPYLMYPNSYFARFHANQGLLLLLCSIVSSMVSEVPLIGTVAWVFTAICFLKGISNVVHHRVRELPLIGKFRLLK